MSTQREMITDNRGPARQVSIIFKKSAEWNGISIRHVRVGSADIAQHWLQQHEIAIPLEGYYVWEVYSATGSRKSFKAVVGDTPILPSYQVFSARCDEELEYLAIHLDPALLTEAASDLTGGNRVELVQACDARDPLIRQIGLALMVESESKHPAGRLYAESLGNALSVHLLRHYTTSSSKLRMPNGGLAGFRLNRATEFIRENLSRDLALSEIASVVGLSPFYFTRAFKRTTGLTPHQYLMKARIERAQALLEKDDSTLVEVCHLVGFQSQSHFTTLFRKLTGLTPKAYRDLASRKRGIAVY